ncbi:MAG: TonB-dependent receptor [Candidatus Angelobacter sp.]|nr:TonB-dependent receptor [Candidatus Angelobacter sp.]
MSRTCGIGFSLLRNSLFVALFACLICGTVAAQVTSGTIFGSVKDPSGAYVPKASVVVKSPQIGVERKVVSSNSGTFTVPNLPPATYTITVEAPGFQRLEKQGVTLSAADRLNAGDFQLTVGAAESSVTVTADAAQLQLQTNSGERSDLITNKQLNNVALNGRMVLDYMKLIPGVVSSFDGHQSGTGGIDAFNINGTRANQHEFTIDGASNVDTGNNGGTHVTINPDAIEDVKVLTSNYQAEYGKAAGGQVVITTKSGTNQFHGNARYFHRHEGLNANDWFAKQNDTPIAKYRYNYAGYQLGGPVLVPGTDFNKSKNKLFFFWGQEYYNQLIPVSGVTTFYTPTVLERQGDFSQSKDGNGNPILISGPAIVNNKIVPSMLSASQKAMFDQVQKILNLYPQPNVSGHNDYNYSTTLSYANPRREDILRVDYQLNDKNRLFARWIHNTDNQAAPILPWPGLGTFACAGAINLAGGCTSTHPGWNLSTSLVSTITPTIINEFSVGPSVTKTRTDSVGGSLSVGKNGINLPLLYPVSPDQSIPDMGFGGVPGVNFGWSYLGATPWYQANTTINLNDNLTWARGKHTLKTGIFYQRSRKDQISWGNVNGQFSFSTNPTAPSNCPANTTCGDPYASALLGMFQNFSQSSARPEGFFRYNQLEFYVQDTWKLTPRLTLDYGMRFSWIPPQYDAKNQIAVFDPNAYDPAKAVHVNSDGSIDLTKGGNPLNGLVFTNNGTAPDGGWNSRGIMPEPRLGFAYDPFGDHKTVLRGGVGMMHDRTQGNLIFNTVFNNPALVVTPKVSSNNISNLPSLTAAAQAGITSPLTSIFGAEKGGKVPTVYSFSLGVQRDLGAGITMDVAYVGTMSRHLVTSRDINAIPYGTAFTKAAQDPNCFPGGVVPNVEPNLPQQYAAAGYSFSGQCALGRSSFTNAPLVPYKGYDQIEYLKFDGTSNYNSLQVSLQRRFSKGLTFGAAYTWSKSLTTANGDEDRQDPFNPLLDYRAAGWDRTHVVAINYVYDLPNVTKHFDGPKWLSAITDNFQLSGVTQFMTGTPIDLNNGFSFESGALTGSNMWAAIPYYYTLDKSGNVVAPQIGLPTRGTRDILRSGGMQNWDMSLFKNIHVGSNEQRYIQLRLEGFNAFNHPNFQNKYYNINVDGPWQWNSPSTPVTVSKGSTWGQNSSQYGGVGGPRVVQLGAKFYF